jgi:hypothetical protein
MDLADTFVHILGANLAQAVILFAGVQVAAISLGRRLPLYLFLVVLGLLAFIDGWPYGTPPPDAPPRGRTTAAIAVFGFILCVAFAVLQWSRRRTPTPPPKDEDQRPE